MLLDANILLYAVDTRSPFHARAADWLSEQLNGARRVGLPWQSLVAFLRISTHPRASEKPLEAASAARIVEDWLKADVVWIPMPGPHHASVLTGLIGTYQLRGNLISDAHLAALAIEHGLTMCSADTDFARFPEVTWINPVRP
ncbi:MAG: PIN domain-containing protein [Geodermatophilaceae bacterium]|nr:PIN domain-containing protein [Geodermatophilaceae bacterium]